MGVPNTILWLVYRDDQARIIPIVPFVLNVKHRSSNTALGQYIAAIVPHIVFTEAAIREQFDQLAA